MNERKQRIIIISIVCTSVLIISLIAYLVNIDKSKEIAQEESQDFESSYESASTQMGKTVEEVEKTTNEEDIEEKEEVEESDENEYDNPEVVEEKKETFSDIEKENVAEEKEDNEDEKESTVETISEENKEEDINTEPVTFEAPIKGEIIREFASDTLVYSETLKEWILHNGIDIKADKTSVVSSAAAGTVYAIKNDPRYGLTVIINHNDGYQTIYSNLLTAEFVVQGEKVEKGQSIGTVGNTATFEIMDDYHLHFELLQNNQYLDPAMYMEFQ